MSNYDVEPAKRTYASFTQLMKWGAIVVIAVTALVILMIAD